MISGRVKFMTMLGGFAVLAIATFGLVRANPAPVLESIDQLRLAGSNSAFFETLLVFGYLLLCVGVAALCLPVSALVVGAGGAIIGFAGLPVSLAGMTIGSLVPFVLARRLAGPALEKIDAVMVTRFRRGFARNDFQFLVLLRVVPWAPFPVTTIIAGALNMKATKFAFATALGFVPSGLALNAIGHGLTRLAGLRDISAANLLLDRDFLLAGLGVGVLVALTLLGRRFDEAGEST